MRVHVRSVNNGDSSDTKVNVLPVQGSDNSCTVSLTIVVMSAHASDIKYCGNL